METRMEIDTLAERIIDAIQRQHEHLREMQTLVDEFQSYVDRMQQMTNRMHEEVTGKAPDRDSKVVQMPQAEEFKIPRVLQSGPTRRGDDE